MPLLRSGDTGVAGIQFARADSLLSRAEALDSQWVEPIVERGLLALERVKARFETRSSIETGLNHANRALALEPNDPGALELRAFLRYFWWALVEPEMESQTASHWLENVEHDLRAAIKSEPTRASAHATLSHVLAARGAPVEAYMEARTAYELDVYLEEPQVTLWRLFVSAYDLPRPSDARRWCNEGRRRFAQDPRFVQCGIWIASLPGTNVDPKEVWALYRKHLELNPAQPENIQDRVALMAVAAGLARAGLRDSAQAVADKGRNDTLDPGRELAYLQAFV
jgi:serine/threonine-protein kinase